MPSFSFRTGFEIVVALIFCDILQRGRQVNGRGVQRGESEGFEVGLHSISVRMVMEIFSGYFLQTNVQFGRTPNVCALVRMSSSPGEFPQFQLVSIGLGH